MGTRLKKMTYSDYFKRATGFDPYPYQTALAESRDPPVLLRVPTGAGKTEAAVLGWLYLRCERADAAVPRRLVYCLPMRTLVDQTVERIEEWVGNLGIADDVGVVKLMGGEPRTQWYLHPEKPFVVVGTQDMLLSRALNRGYGMSYNMWPVEYGLLNNDCLWVMDEVQLMANGLPTSTQLAGLRGKLETYGPARSMWMSATARSDWLDTIDHPEPPAAKVVELGHDDLADPRLRKRHNALKVVAKGAVDFKKQKEMAELISKKHQSGTLTLAIVNTVERAQKLYAELVKPRNKLLPHVEKVLIHSRFREDDRQKKQDRIVAPLGPAGRVVVATQAVEAGVDISAQTLITELAPWASMVQRFGRCNREGKYERGDVLWADVDKDTAPYEPDDIAHARAIMESLQGKSVGPAALEEMGDKMEGVDHVTVIRRRDVVGLFDTTPDLSGSYLDVSQYVRGADETGVTVFWRDVPEDDPCEGEPRPRHNETVNVPLGDSRGGPKGIKDYLDSERKAWVWDFLDSQWREIRPREIHPGMTLMLDANQGGYDPDIGWDASGKERLEPVSAQDEDGEPEPEGQGSEPTNTSQRKWGSLSDHSRHVEAEARAILDALSEQFEPGVLEAVALAALYHDAGKAHPAFQEMLRQDGEGPPEGVLLAKSRGNGRMGRRHFRHELGSALALLEHAHVSTDHVRGLAAYLAAAHHGKVRLGIRSLPGARRNNRDRNPEADELLGYRVSKPETLPPVDLGQGLRVPETILDMSIARMGIDENERQSWLERSLLTLERLGPFRLAYLEAIVRATDMRASAEEQKEAAE